MTKILIDLKNMQVFSNDPSVSVLILGSGQGHYVPDFDGGDKELCQRLTPDLDIPLIEHYYIEQAIAARDPDQLEAAARAVLAQVRNCCDIHDLEDSQAMAELKLQLGIRP